MKIIASMIFLLFVIDALALTEKAFIDKVDKKFFLIDNLRDLLLL
jgi:hypothetical protein